MGVNLHLKVDKSDMRGAYASISSFVSQYRDTGDVGYKHKKRRLDPDDLKKVARLAEEALLWYFFKRKESPLLPFKSWFKDYDFKVTLVRKK
jgi:hypothetical protein